MFRRLAFGDSGNEVLKLKRILKSLHYNIDDRIDTFDNNTVFAVESFQNDNRIKISGIVDEKTSIALDNANTDKSISTDEENAQPDLKEVESKEEVSEITSNTNNTVNKITSPSNKETNNNEKNFGDSENDKVGISEYLPNDNELSIKNNYDNNNEYIEKVILEKYDYYEPEFIPDNDKYVQPYINPEMNDYINTVIKSDTVSNEELDYKYNKFIDSQNNEVEDISLKDPEDYIESSNIGVDLTAYQDANSETYYKNNCTENSNMNNPYIIDSDNSTYNNLISDHNKLYNNILVVAASKKPNLKTGSKGDYVHELQEYLKELGYYNAATDGIFGPQTAEAVKNFQLENGLKADSIVGKDTWDALDSALYDNTHKSPPFILRKGSTGMQVIDLQKKLNQLNCFFDIIDGVFGSRTEESVKAYQTAKELNADGIVGEKTWYAINNDLAPSTVASNFEIRPLLLNDSKGFHVTEIQNILSKSGYYEKPVDGLFGNATCNAVQNFQRANRLDIDGIVGPMTWSALESTKKMF